MVRVGKKSKSRKQKNEHYQNVNSDNEFDQDNNGGLNSKNPYEDDAIEQFHSQGDKILLNKIGATKAKKTVYDYSSNEEEVLAFDDSSDNSSNDEGESDMDDKVYGTDMEEDDLDDDDMEQEQNGEEEYDDSGKWGRKKGVYYSGNKLDNEEDALLEEEEAKALQAKMLKQLDTNDFGLDAFKVDEKAKLLKTEEELKAEKRAKKTLGNEDDESLQKIAKNLSIMSKKEKLDFLQRESPELFELIRDFKLKLEELDESLLPISKLIKTGQIPNSTASEFIANKTKLYLTYCCHLSFYFVLKTQRIPVDNHPIVKNILQFRNLIKQISEISVKLEDEVNFIVQSIKDNKQLNFSKSKKTIKAGKKTVSFKSRNIPDGLLSDDDSDIDEMLKTEDKEEEGENGATEEVEKRAINYQISKNKGLTPKRNKMYRNPRIKYKTKARVANIKRKSIVPKVRSQDSKYTGEATGIRTGIVRSAKF